MRVNNGMKEKSRMELVSGSVDKAIFWLESSRVYSSTTKISECLTQALKHIEIALKQLSENKKYI